VLFNSSVKSLSQRISPSAIGWLVVSAWVNSVDAMLAVRFHAHIGKEVFKRTCPSIAHRNAGTSIVSILSIIWVSASLQHCPPAVVLGASPSFSGVAVSRHPFNTNLPAEASAASSFSASQLGRHDSFFGSARASAIPCRLFADVFGSADNCQSSKDLPVKLNYVFPAVHRPWSSHCLLPLVCAMKLTTPSNRNATRGESQYA
jgi:hypothetical protein